MLYSKKQILKMILIWGILTLMVLIIITTSLDPINPMDMESSYKDGMGIVTYFNILNGNRYFQFVFVLVALIPSIIVIDNYKYYHNKFIYLINERIPFRKYMVKMLIYTFLTSFIFYLIMNITVLLLVHTTYIPLYFKEGQEITILFSISPILNLFFYILCSCIGFGIYNVFLLQIIVFIKNEFVFRAFALINFIATLIIYSILSGLVIMCIGIATNFDLLRIFLSFLVPINLYTPGLLFEEYGTLAFILSSITYIGISMALWKIAYKKVMTSG